MITAEKSALEEAIRQALKVRSRHASLPMLQQARFTADRNELTVEATDLEISVSCKVEARNSGMLESRQEFCLDAENVGKALRALPREVKDVPIAIGEKDVAIGDISLVKNDAGEFPEIPVIPAGAVHEYALPDDFAELARKVVPAASKETTRYPLTGVYCDFKRGTMVSSDGKRLHAVSLGAKKKMPGLILPPKCLAIANAVAIVVAKSKKKKAPDTAFLVTGNGYVSARIVEGVFPDYTQVIPETRGRTLQADRDQLHDMLKELSAISTERCTLSLDGTIILSTEKSDVGAYKKVVPGKYKGENLTISVNPSFLADAVGAVASNEVTIRFKDAASAMVVTGEDDPFRAVLMPLSVTT